MIRIEVNADTLRRPREAPGNDAYMYYTRKREDGRYDHLAILGIRRE
ncbi:MAG: hypothetical protein LBR93_05765 [Treponema sp.]|nr:hypothetical protein [Treponema sp.]